MSNTETRERLICPECGADFYEERDRCPRDGASLEPLRVSDSEEVDPLMGEVLDDRFRIDSILGEGGMGRVYRGEQLSVERDVAIKVIRTERCDDETSIKRFFREARVISKFSHPNIVNLIDFGRDEQTGALYFVMEVIEGVALEEITGEDRFASTLVVEVGKQTCAALSEPHSHDVVHRDLKPENLILVPISDGRIQTKVVDFGVAQAMQERTALTDTGAVCGTPSYMAPEQAHGWEVGPYTDVYSLGVTLYEMLAGRRPFTGGTSIEIMYKHVQEDPPSLGDDVPIAPDVPLELVRLVERMLEKEPEDRPQDILEVRAEFERLEERFDLEKVRVDPESPPEEMFADLRITQSGRRRRVPSSETEADTDAPASLHDTDDAEQLPATSEYEPDRAAVSDVPTQPEAPETSTRRVLLAIAVGLTVLAAVYALWPASPSSRSRATTASGSTEEADSGTKTDRRGGRPTAGEDGAPVKRDERQGAAVRTLRTDGSQGGSSADGADGAARPGSVPSNSDATVDAPANEPSGGARPAMEAEREDSVPRTGSSDPETDRTAGSDSPDGAKPSSGATDEAPSNVDRATREDASSASAPAVRAESSTTEESAAPTKSEGAGSAGDSNPSDSKDPSQSESKEDDDGLDLFTVD